MSLVIVGAWAAPAFAHAVLEGTDPGSGATVQRSPKDITLTFNEPVEASLGAIRVFDSHAPTGWTWGARPIRTARVAR